MKNTADVHLCSRKHLHRSQSAASICDAAWRYVERKRLKTDELAAELREVLASARRRRFQIIEGGRV